MTKDYMDYLDDILDAMYKSRELVKGLSFSDFEKNYQVNYAVVRCLEIIGEAVKRIPDDIRKRNTKIPWAAMAGMRDRLIHGYDNINLALVWETVKNIIPELIEEFKKYTKE